MDANHWYIELFNQIEREGYAGWVDDLPDYVIAETLVEIEKNQKTDLTEGEKGV